MKFLFLCTSNIHRSKTAQDYFQSFDSVNEYKSAGLNERNCKKFGSTLCSEELLEWADIVFVMEEKHIERIKLYTADRFIDKIINLDIEDEYGYMDQKLIEHLIKKVRHFEQVNFNQALEIISPVATPGKEIHELRWLQEDGAKLTKGEPLYVIENSKAFLEVEAPISGKLKISLPSGTQLDVVNNHILGWINPSS